MFVAACAVTIEGCEQAIFSTGRRASQKLLELVYTFLCKIPGVSGSIIRHNVECIWIQGPHGKDDIRKIYSYPSKVKIYLFFFFFFFFFFLSFSFLHTTAMVYFSLIL